MDKLNKLLEEYPNGKGDLDSLKFLRGFIKWLVDNGKIDRSKVNFEKIFYKYDGETITDKERILMLLAIQDEPIEFLISILK